MTRCAAVKGYDDTGRLSLYLSAFGHADYAEEGKDIVCAAVSALCTAMANTLIGYGVPKQCFRMAGGNFFVNALIEEKQAQCEGAYDMAVEGLTMLAEQYPDHVFVGSGVSH